MPGRQADIAGPGEHSRCTALGRIPGGEVIHGREGVAARRGTFRDLESVQWTALKRHLPDGRPIGTPASQDRSRHRLGASAHSVDVRWATDRGASEGQRTPSNRRSMPGPCQPRSVIDLADDELTGHAYGLTTLKVPPKASIPLPLPAVPVVIRPIAPTNGCSWL